MRLLILAFATSAAVCALLVPLIRRFALRHELFDQVTSSRKVHAAAVPRLGGVAIVAGFLAPFLVALLDPNGPGAILDGQSRSAVAFIAGAVAIAGLGLFDDLLGAGARVKFSVQVLVAAYVWAAGFRIEQISLPNGAVLPLGIFGFLVSLVWMVGVMNALNLIDGLDGLAGGVALIAALANLVLAISAQHALSAMCMAALAGSLASFLFFNFNPATIFMGDAGSLFLGYVLALCSIHTHQKSSTAVSLLVPVVALALPIADTLLAMGRRALRARPLFAGDKEHIHHLLLARGIPHRTAVLVLYGASILLGAGALSIALLAPRMAVAALCVLSLGAGLALWLLGAFRILSPDVLQERKRNLALRSAVRTMTGNLRRAASVLDVFESLERLAPAIEASASRLELYGAESWKPAPAPAPCPGGIALRARFAVEPRLGHLEIEWTDGRPAPDRDHEIAAEALCLEVSRALERFRAATRRSASFGADITRPGAMVLAPRVCTPRPPVGSGPVMGCSFRQMVSDDSAARDPRSSLQRRQLGEATTSADTNEPEGGPLHASRSDR